MHHLTETFRPVDLHAPECLEVLFVAFIALPQSRQDQGGA